MALAETAKLLTELDLDDSDYQAGMAKAASQAAAYGRATDQAAVQTTRFSRVSKGAGNALHHFGGRVSQVTQLLGATGLVGGLLAVGAAVKTGVAAAEDWGRTTDRLTQLTGASVKEASQFADAYDKLGISQEKQIRIMGFLSKTLGNWNVNRKQARQVEKDYGFDLIGSNGKMKDALTITQDFTAYFNNKHIPSYQKASLGTKLFGRGWTDMIPVFEKGEKAMRRAMDDAMSLNKEQVRDLHKWRDAQRELNDSVGDLQVQIGLAAIPALTELSRNLTDFVNKNERKIRMLFGQGLEAAKGFAGFIANDVAPTLVNLGKSAVDFWNAIPGPLRDILLKGLVADRALKFAFGFSVTGLAADALKDAIGSGLGRLFGRGSSPATPMYVKAVGGLGGAAGAAGGGMGVLGKVGLAAEAVGLGVAVVETVDGFMRDRAAEQAQLAEQAKGLLNDTAAKSLDDITNMTRLMAEANATDRAGIQTFASKELGDALRNVGTNLVAKVTDATRATSIEKLIAAQQQAISYGWNDVADKLGADIKALQEGKGGEGGDPPAARRTNKLLVEQTGVQRAFIHQMKRAERSGDRGQERAYNLLKRGIMGDKDNADAVRKAIKVMEREQKEAQERGATRLARNIGRDIAVLRRATSGGLSEATRAVNRAASQPPPVVNVTTNVSSTIGVRSGLQAASIVNRYGRATAF